MRQPARVLDAAAQAIIAEEEALLARVRASLEAARGKHADKDTQGLAAQLQVLRDDAATAHVADLPHLLQQMTQARALLERQEATQLPDAHAPYFAHLRLEAADGARDYLLGRTSFADTGAGVRIIDWRYAPVARVFYLYGEGDFYEEQFGARVSEGTVEARRLVVIERGVLTRISAGSLQLERDAASGEWRQVTGTAGADLGGGTGTAVRAGYLGVGRGAAQREETYNVTALLDAEQFDAVSTAPDKPLVVLGSAGSGKTTVALHRLAKVAFDAPKRFTQGRMRVIVPEEGLARLSRRLLAPLGLERVEVQTLEHWSLATAKAAFGVRALPLWGDTPPLVSRLKRHPALRRALAARVGVLGPAATSLERLRGRLGDAFTDRRFLEGVVTHAKGALPSTAVEETVRHTRLQLADPLSEEFEGVDPERLQTVDGLALEAETPDALAGTLDVEDLPLLLLLRAQAGELGVPGLAHVVLDEAEDFSLFELFVVGKLLGDARSCTVAGDEMQQTSTAFAGWPAVMAELGIRDATTVRLQTAYRCPGPVVELARHVLGQPVASGAQAGRAGAPVGLHHFPDEAQAQLFVGEALRDLVEREPHASVAVICHSRESAQAFHRVVADMPWARLVTEGAFTFEPGVDVTDVDGVKGLEFDYVILPDATARAYPANDEARRRLHVAVTRASHQLWVVTSGVRSPLLPRSH
jgi:DNA helicase IV